MAVDCSHYMAGSVLRCHLGPFLQGWAHRALAVQQRGSRLAFTSRPLAAAQSAASITHGSTAALCYSSLCRRPTSRLSFFHLGGGGGVRGGHQDHAGQQVKCVCQHATKQERSSRDVYRGIHCCVRPKCMLLSCHESDFTKSVIFNRGGRAQDRQDLQLQEHA